jgi:hypothetical protein
VGCEKNRPTGTGPWGVLVPVFTSLGILPVVGDKCTNGNIQSEKKMKNDIYYVKTDPMVRFNIIKMAKNNKQHQYCLPLMILGGPGAVAYSS